MSAIVTKFVTNLLLIVTNVVTNVTNFVIIVTKFITAVYQKNKEHGLCAGFVAFVNNKVL